MLCRSTLSSKRIAVSRSNASCASACRYARSSASVRPPLVTTLPVVVEDEQALQVPVEPGEAVVVDDELGEPVAGEAADAVAVPVDVVRRAEREVDHVEAARLVRRGTSRARGRDPRGSRCARCSAGAENAPSVRWYMIGCDVFTSAMASPPSQARIVSTRGSPW